jgi:AraC-like DNA-binding protein
MFRRFGIAARDLSAQCRFGVERTVRLASNEPRVCLAPQEWAQPGMLSSTTGVFREPDDFQAAMREYGCTNLVAIGHGIFRARLTRIELHRLRLLSAEESLARIAFFAIPRDAILVSVPLGDGPPPTWGGTASRAGDIVTFGGQHRIYTRSGAGGRWGIIVLPAKLLETYAQTVVGDALTLAPAVSHRRPSTKARRDLVRLHISATRVADAQAEVITMSEPARTLEQDLIGAIIACLSKGSAEPGSDANARHDDIMARFEELLQAHPRQALTSDEICAALDVSRRMLRMCCGEHLGMGPTPYIRLRRLQLARRALRCADAATASVVQIASEYGFGDAGRFAGDYRAQFGELPSATLRRSAGQ